MGEGLREISVRDEHRSATSCICPDWRLNPQLRVCTPIRNRTHKLLVNRTILPPTQPPDQGLKLTHFKALKKVLKDNDLNNSRLNI